MRLEFEISVLLKTNDGYIAPSLKIEQKMSECPHCPVDLIISQGHQIQWNTIGYIWIAQAPDLSRLISPSFIFKYLLGEVETSWHFLGLKISQHL